MLHPKLMTHRIGTRVVARAAGSLRSLIILIHRNMQRRAQVLRAHSAIRDACKPGVLLL